MGLRGPSYGTSGASAAPMRRSRSRAQEKSDRLVQRSKFFIGAASLLALMIVSVVATVLSVEEGGGISRVPVEEAVAVQQQQQQPAEPAVSTSQLQALLQAVQDAESGAAGALLAPVVPPAAPAQPAQPAAV